MIRRMWASLLALFMLASALAGCSGAQETKPETQTQPVARDTKTTQAPKQTAYPITLKDGAGRDVTIKAEPKRIVSMAPSNTELVFALGRGSSMVARGEFDDYPAEVKNLPSIGGIQKVEYEKIVSLQPDLFLMIGGSDDVRNKLANDHGITVFVLDPKNFDQLYDGIKTLGVAINAQEQAEKMVADMQKSVKEIADKTSKANNKPKVFYEVWHDPLMTAGSETWIDDLIKLAGGVNAGGDVKGWTNYSLEKLQAGNPDIILVGGEKTATELKARKGWEGIKAVKENKVLVTIDPSLLTRPGPRLVQGLKWMAETLQPELIK